MFCCCLIMTFVERVFEYGRDYSCEISSILCQVSPACESKSFSSPGRGSRIFLIKLLEMPKFSFSLAMNFPPKSSLHFLYNFKASFEYRFKKFICGYNV